MKIVIANRDIDDPAETKEIAPITLDLKDIDDVGARESPDFSAEIAEAAAAVTMQLSKEQQKQKRYEVQAKAAEEFKLIADRLKESTGYSIGYEMPWAYRPKVKAAYGLWKRVVTLFVEVPKTLDLGPTDLAKWLNDNEPNYTVTRDLMYDKLNDFAQKDLVKLLAKLGVTLALKKPATIRSVQKQLIERRDAAKSSAVEEFSAHFVIRGDKAYVNCKPYTIQLGSSGKRRIKRGGRDWLSLDVLKGFCSGT